MALFVPGQDGAPLAMLSLGVVGDVRPMPDLQPPLPEGIHLRWAFRRDPDPALDRGFPWFGFYLLRRQSPGGNPTCVSTLLGAQTPGTIGPSLTLSLGVLSSDQNLHLTDDFAPSGTVEVDLSGRTFVKLQMNPATPMREVKVTVGLVADFPPLGGDGGGNGPGSSGTDGGLGGAPGASTGACPCGCGQTAIQPFVDRVVSLGNGTFRATFGYTNGGETPVSIPVGSDNRFRPDPADRGQPALFARGRHGGAFVVDFDGRPITWTLTGTTVTASAADATQPTSGTPGPGSSGVTDGILVTALRNGFTVGERVVSGKAGDVVAVTLPFEAIDAVVVTSGPARLIDVCATLLSDGIGQGWSPVGKFPDPAGAQPMCLPVSDPAYPCNIGSNNEVSAKQLAFGRIRYGTVNNNGGVLSAPEWDGSVFTDIHSTLLQIVSGGPTKPGGITDHVSSIDATPDPTDPAAIPPQWADQSSLDVLLAASVNPAMAQMLGLYWVDDTAFENVSYDYLLVADYTGVGALNVLTVLGLVAAQNFSKLDAYLKIGAMRSATPPLAPPTNPKAYELPLKAVPAGAPGDAAGLVGLRWDIPAATAGAQKIDPDGAIMFHVWRDAFGRATPAGPAAPEAYIQLTDLPLAPSRSFDPTQVISGWPAFALFAIDGPLVEGWYGYRVSGIDIFGRYSARSDVAPWLAIADEQVLDQSAVHVIDTTPPPAPTQVKAWILDPADLNVTQDDAYKQWRPGHLTAVGLRVRWVWPRASILQAPDTREFRIYIQPGSFMDGPGNLLNWNQRVAVVGLNEQIVIDDRTPMKNAAGASLTGQGATAAIDASGIVRATLAGTPALAGLLADGLELELTAAAGGTARFAVAALDALAGVAILDRDPKLTGPSGWTLFHERTYEVFLPGAALAVPAAATVPLPTTPSLTVPVAYGLVGVSAADDKDRDDPRKDLASPGPFVPRSGNEGAVGGPAVVYQVWRTIPDPPTATFSEDKLLATRADFNSKSFFQVHFDKQAHLSTDVFRALDETLFLVDAQNTKRNAEATAITATTLGWLTSQNQPDSARRTAALNQITAASPPDYGKLSNDALRILASLPSNAPAFSRITNPPLRSDDPVNDDRVGPNENPPPYAPQANRGAYLDTLDGRASNRYFYRTAHVDDAHNQGPMGASTPPVYLPIATVPAPPVVVDATSGEKTVTLSWRSSADPEVAEYRIYRSDTEPGVRRLLASDRISTVAEPTPPEQRDTIVKTVPPLPADGGQRFFYAITAATAASTGVASRESGPSTVIALSAFEDARPAPPVWGPAQPQGTVFFITWTTTETSLRNVLVQRRLPPGTDWQSISGWLPATARSFLDQTRSAGVQYEYRLLVIDQNGRRNKQDIILLI